MVTSKPVAVHVGVTSQEAMARMHSSLYHDGGSSHPGTTWQYLGFFFDPAITFQEHVKRYTNKALTVVRAMLALGNSVHGLWPKHK
jgi:hypothetical protein